MGEVFISYIHTFLKVFSQSVQHLSGSLISGTAKIQAVMDMLYESALAMEKAL